MTYFWAFLFLVNMFAALLPETGTWIDYASPVLLVVVLVAFALELRKEFRARKQQREQLQ